MDLANGRRAPGLHQVDHVQLPGQRANLRKLRLQSGVILIVVCCAQRFQLASDSGDAAQDYGEIAKQEHLSAIEVEVRKLNDKVRGVRNEQDYQKVRTCLLPLVAHAQDLALRSSQKCEEKFRDMSESTNSRVMWWSILQTVVLVMSGLWQIRNMTVRALAWSFASESMLTFRCWLCAETVQGQEGCVISSCLRKCTHFHFRAIHSPPRTCEGWTSGQGWWTFKSSCGNIPQPNKV